MWQPKTEIMGGEKIVAPRISQRDSESLASIAHSLKRIADYLEAQSRSQP